MSRAGGAPGAGGDRRSPPVQRNDASGRTNVRRRARRRLAIAIGLLALLALCGLAWARPGGGESFSGGGGHGGGGGGGGGGGDDGGWIVVIDLVIRLVILTIEYPYIMLPLFSGVIVAFIVGALWNLRNKDWNSGPPVSLARTAAEAAPARTDLRTVDPDFSWILFEDFAFRLFATAHGARGNPAAMAALAPYVGPAVRTALAEREPAGAPVSRVIVGALRVYDSNVPRAAPDSGQAWIGVELEANYSAGGRTWYSIERWGFVRGLSAKTRPPRAARDFPCPNCGAPWAAKDSAGGQVCASCGEAVDNGRFDWQVTTIDLRHADPRPPTLTHEVPERGNDLPTYKAPGCDRAWQKLLADDPALDRAGFDARVDLAYRALNDAWAQNDLAPARGFVSDGLYDYLSYWVSAYAAQGLRNGLDDMRITKRALAKVTRDRWYDAVTVRIFATGKDYVVDQNGHVVRGSRTRARPYTEYWTFIRSAARRGAPVLEKACPSCGAPLAIGMSGACAHCGAHVTAGEFDWVLSKVEQDDTYRG